MISVRNIRVRSFDLDRLDLWWEVYTTSEDPQDYDTRILRSESPQGPYELLTSTPIVDEYTFRDTAPGLLHNWRRMYYRVQLTHRATGEVKDFPDNNGASVDPPLTLEAMEAVRYEEVLFREHIGRPCWLFKRRTFGPHCPHCWDSRQGRQTTKRCAACFGGGYMRGYMSPILFYCQIDPATEGSQLSSIEQQQEQLAQARCIFYPPVNDQDVVVELENIRWRVNKVLPTRRLRSVIHQEFQIRLIPPGGIEFDLPLDLNLEHWTDSPSRDFTNPQNLEGADGATLEMGALMNVYGWRF